MALEFIAGTLKVNTASTDIFGEYPSGMRPNDMIVAVGYSAAETLSPYPESGFAGVSEASNGSFFVVWKYATGAETPGGNFRGINYSGGGSISSAVMTLVYRAVDNPKLDSAAATKVYGSLGDVFQSNSFTPGKTGWTITVGGGDFAGGPYTWTMGTGQTQDFATSDAQYHLFASHEAASEGVSSSGEATCSSSVNLLRGILAFQVYEQIVSGAGLFVGEVC